MHCDWFILPLLLPTPTIWFSLDHKRNVSDGVVSGVGRKWKRSDSSDSDSVALMTPLTTPTPTPSLVKTSLYDFLVMHLWLKILAFWPAQPKRNQKLQCLRLRETNNPIIFIWEFPRPERNRAKMTSATV